MFDPLDPQVLHAAYSRGYFPMPDPETGEILWFCPDPRAVIPLDTFKSSRSLLRSIRKYGYTATFDRDFKAVINGCSERKETWINEEFRDAYYNLHQVGLAHSVEVWHDNILVGGLYGVHIGGGFFAESKFRRKTDASKAALHFLVEHLRAQNFELLEVQFMTPHLETLGAVGLPKKEYLAKLERVVAKDCQFIPLRPEAGDKG